MKNNVLIVSHDAGGAEVLSAWCEQNAHRYRLLHCLRGPAVGIFERDFGAFPLVGLEAMDTFGERDFVLTGSSLEADLERTAIAMAKSRGMCCVTFLDHWDLYRERFNFSNGYEKGLPNEIWVGDEYAYAYAQKVGLPESRLKLVQNPYFTKVKRLYENRAQMIPSERQNILYICEPISRKLSATFGSKASMYDNEIVIMDKFLASASHFGHRVDRLTLRLHPSEAPKKYETLVASYLNKLSIRYSQGKTLVDDISEHNLILGIESTGLIIGILLEKKVYSCITGKPWTISLPHRKLKRVNDFDIIFNSLPINQVMAERMGIE